VNLENRVRLLLGHCSDLDAAYRLAVLNGNVANAALLKAEPIPLEPGEEPDRAPLRWAAYNHQDEVVAYLRATP